MILSSLMANTEGYRLVRCPKCLNILPEPPNVTVYRCGGCGTTLRAKIRASNGQHVATKRQDSDNYSVATAVSNGVPAQTKDHASSNGQHVATKRQDSNNYSVATAVSNGVPTQTKDHASSNGQHVATKWQDSDNYSVATAVSNGVPAQTKDHASSNGQHVATKRQDSDDYSVATSVSNGVPSQTKDHASTEVTMDNSCIADVPSTEHDSNGTGNTQSGDIMLPEKRDVGVENDDSKDHHNIEGQDTNSRTEGPGDLENTNANSTCRDSGEAENQIMEQPEENSEIYRVGEGDDTECHLNASENNMLSSEMSKAAVSIQDAEQKEAGQAEHAANKKSHLVRVLSRSCDLRASSITSLDFHSARTSLQSKSFRASEPLQSKIMNTVDELKGDLSELFKKPSESKQKAYPPRPSKQDAPMTRAAITSSAPLASYHPTAKHYGYAARLSRSGQVAPRGLPSLRYRRHRVYSYHHNVQMEMRPCRHECCHSCQPPCYRSCKQEPAAMHKPPPVKEIKRRPVSRNHCRPVLGGAPFVICSNCVRLVQLPTDFAVPSRGTRRLQCGSCSEVLSYSYRDPSRKKPQSPFGGDEYSTDGYEIHHHQADAGFEQADPVSYSEEYGLSFGVSHSTSTEDGQPLYVSRNSSFNTVDERAGRDGKLHRLMGYSSASELLLHSPDLFESFDGRMVDAKRTHVDRKGKGVCVAEGDAAKRPKARSGNLQGILKKGIHGLESLKLRS